MLQCEALGLSIRNYDIGPISYFNPQTNDIRQYYPDFIINDFLIIEIKWIGFVYKKKKPEILAKRKALEKFCEESGKYASLFVSNNMIKKKYINLAKKIHEKNYGTFEHSSSRRGEMASSKHKRSSRDS